ncbi:alpha/beta hydrolase fold domain-containing protein [Sarocladium implicatum]|nr:alpha/beta hydrolase fold domain-containing protein [Sarocladium implicatum]
MFEGLELFTVKTSDDPHVDISGLKSGDANASRPALLLLHGFPQSRHIWHRVAPQLLDHYTLVVPDLRGYGESSKPGSVKAYAKSEMARDLVSVMEQLGHQSFFVCGHDRGGRVAHKMCVDYPDRVLKVMFLDICPTLAMFDKTDFDFAKAYWHWFFLMQPAPLPETMIGGDPRRVTSLMLCGREGDNVEIFDKDCLEYYLSAMSDPDAVHAACNDYRAAGTLDLDEAREDLRQSRRIQCPVRVLWGKHGVIEKCFDALAEWRAVSDPGVDVDGQAVESGHYIPEQVPDDVVANIRQFFC